MGMFYKQLVYDYRNAVVERFNKLLKGNISVAQAHAERQQIIEIFEELANDLQAADEGRDKAQLELRKTQLELMRLANN